MEETLKRLRHVESDISLLKLELTLLKLMIASVLAVGCVSFVLAKLIH